MLCRILFPLLLCVPTVLADGIYELPNLEVHRKGAPMVGEAVSASHGVIGRVDLETRPITRVGEILETVPGMIATQHSGSGKANQYFLRGFNLDHGTDFATWVEGMPVNMATHGHGQGYTDLNFLIPETVRTITYLKGPYYSGVGDFSSAGSASIRVLDTLEEGELKFTVGEDNLFRVVATDSYNFGGGSDLLYAFERETNDGPWDLAEDLAKHNGMLKYSNHEGDRDMSVTLMAYEADWTSTDQVPERAIRSGLISDLGFIDPTVGGQSSRYSLSADYGISTGGSQTRYAAYAIYYDMNLWSNFTYFLEDPVNGDQFEQADRRMVYGFTATHALQDVSVFDKDSTHIFGFQTRYDDISNVGLYHTKGRERLSTTRQDSVGELAVGAFYDAQIHWSAKFKSSLGVRADYYDFSVDSSLAQNSGSADDLLLTPKVNTVYQASESTELYLSYGYGFHSNDARGTTIAIDPVDGSAVDPVDPLVRSEGYEVGIRHEWSERSNTSISLWSLDLDSELLYVGDAGNTESSRPSGREGIEIASYFAPYDWLSIDFDLALTDAEFRDASADGQEIPGAIDKVASLGLNVFDEAGWYGSLRYRHFGSRALIEDNSVRSEDFDAYNLRVGFKRERWHASIDILNMFDSDDHDITYFYESRLAGEPAGGIADRHLHRIAPRTVRVNFSFPY